MRLCAPFNLPDTKDVIALNGGAVTDQKHSTFFFRKKDVSGLLSWHGTKVPATNSHEREEKKKLDIMIVRYVYYGNTGCGVFKRGVQN